MRTTPGRRPAGPVLAAAVVACGLLVGSPAAAAEEGPSETSSSELSVVVTIPERGPGELIWELDGTDELVDLGIGAGQGDHVAATGTLNEIRVKDSRLGGSSWTISGQVSDFSNGTVSAPAKYLGWRPFLQDNSIDAVAGPAVASGFVTGDGLSRARELASGSDAEQYGSVVLGAELDFRIPYDQGTGVFQAVLTLTALS